ncbi:ABC transporter substrate-binding protein [Williamsia sterculiae]|uniref:Carbohydrate ABC transporter substrate-binding protein, CUT1 family n=1 Tax=Williamsia sterculiae TaxID=1344003 RepID=A0A1N7GS79_9NOCA|nr:ABC transporter substrate-binding protein [Williamsia sterculiae]SIS15409.1 carbohydrate ABC transporter substrate-binding protein, CUT1 family [Williamsia sterculiae]
MVELSRRNFLAAGITAAAGAALTACVGSGSTSNSSSGGGDSNTIVWWSSHPGKSTDVEKELISRFEKANPSLKVQLVDGGKNYEEIAQKFNAALSGGSLPDVVVLSDVWWFNFALLDAIEPLDDHFSKAGVNTADYVDSLFNDYAWNNKHWALPYARSTPLFYYNKALWQQAGLPDRGPASWQEFDEWGPKLQGVVGGGKLAHGWGNATDYLGWTFQGPVWTFGGAYSDKFDLKFTDPKTIEAATYLRDSIHTKKYAAISNDIANDFGAGIIASTIASTGDLSGIAKNAKFEVGTAFLPAPNGPGCPTGGAGLAIPKKISDDRKLNALKFIDFITNAQNTAYFSQKVGYMPVRTSALTDPATVKFLDGNPNFRTAVDQLPKTAPQNYARVFVPGGDKIIGTGFEEIGLRNADVNATMSSVQSQLQTIIDRQITPKLPK